METSRTDETTRFLELADRSDIVIDVGANVGFFTMLALTRGKDCVSIEANPTNAQLLLENLDRNSMVSEVLPVAVSNKVGVVKLFGGGEGASLKENWGGMQSTYTTLVCTHTLDDLVAHRVAGVKALIKIDVEGFEYLALCGASKLLETDPAPDWIIEHGFMKNFSNDGNPHYLDLFELFWEHGYESSTLNTSEPLDRAQVGEIIRSRVDRSDINVHFSRPRSPIVIDA